MKNRPYLIGGAVVGMAIVAQLFCLHLQHSRELRFVAYLAKVGVPVSAPITQKRIYTPTFPERYAQIYYKYTASDGKTYPGKSWVTRKEFDQLEGKFTVDVIYDPKRPHFHMLQSKLLRF
ncbi:MAG TPA: hypothetical protein VL688_09695 [Verrucomicrobiae bacterium]|jgi:hypothetical protein|nr:hypothetical protein [Verrucomicrobiae bacterium]